MMLSWSCLWQHVWSLNVALAPWVKTIQTRLFYLRIGWFTLVKYYSLIIMTLAPCVKMTLTCSSIFIPRGSADVNRQPVTIWESGILVLIVGANEVSGFVDVDVNFKEWQTWTNTQSQSEWEWNVVDVVVVGVNVKHVNWHPVTICECGMLMFMLNADGGKSLLLLTLILSRHLMRMLHAGFNSD